MPAPRHRCEPPYPTKAKGGCVCCGDPVYVVHQINTDEASPLSGHPTRIGAPLETQTQVEFLLTDGSEADVSFCDECARNLRPAHYIHVWRACVERGILALQLARRSANDQRLARLQGERVWPLAVLRRRRQGPEDILVVDRR